MMGLLEGSRIPPTLSAGLFIIVFDRVPIAIEEISAGGSFERRTIRMDRSRIFVAAIHSFEDTDQPGVYTVDTPDGAHSFAINVDPLESKTAALEFVTLEKLGCRLADHSPKPLDHADLRQMYNSELENRQKLWRWLVLAAIGLLIVETWLAGRLRRCTHAAHAEAMVT